LTIKNGKKDFSPLDDVIECEVSNFYSKAYLRHLIKSKEILGLQIASIHNLAFYIDIVSKARQHIAGGTFASWKNEMVVRWQERL